MKKVIGIISEGPTDQMVLKTAINTITGENNTYRMIQPEQNMQGEFGNGWKGVYRWCEKNAGLIPALFTDISPGMDLLIIQMDGDVARKEKEVHCFCDNALCEITGQQSPLECELLKRSQCPIELPCIEHENAPDGYRQCLDTLIHRLLKERTENNRIIITIPCDSTDAWIVAAFDDRDDIETIEDPWKNIISAKKDYHGIRVPGHNKSAAVYRRFMPRLSEQWHQVKEKCKSAELLDAEIQKL